mgnify:CR=1 FL=1
MSEVLLELDNVTAGYGETTVLQNVSFLIHKNEKVSLIGRNGVGKTTFLSTMMGLVDLHSGVIRYKGENISSFSPYQRARIGLGLVPQTRDIFTSLSVEENIIAGMSKDASLQEAYDLFPRLYERRKNGGGQLSGGEQQMLSVARTMIGEPEFLMLDEPLEGLAPVICNMLMKTFNQVANDGKHTVLLVEQHAQLALDFSDRTIILDNGVIVYDGASQHLCDHKDILEKYIGVGLEDKIEGH